MIVVTGATGNIGKKVSEQLLAEGQQVRAIARGRERLADLAAKGAEVLAGSIEDAAFLAKAFAGAEAVLTMIPTHLQAQDILAYQVRVGEAITRGIQDSGVKYVVDISSIGAHTEVGTGIVAGLARQEKRLDALPGVNVLHLRPGYFMENLLVNAQMVKSMGILGSPARPDVKIHIIATADVARFAADRLKKKDFSGKGVQELLGPRDMDMREVTAILGKAIGKPDLPYVQFSYEDAAKAMVGMGLSPSVAESYVAFNRNFNEGSDFRTKGRDAKSTTPTTLETFAPAFAAAYRA
jgi:uncharacterized protein YbjT (DUF2867 family)